MPRPGWWWSPKLAHSKLFRGVTAAKPTAKHPPTRPAVPEWRDLAGNSNGQVLTAVLWGIVGLRRRCAGPVRGPLLPAPALVHLGRGTVGVLVLLYFFFGAVTPLLPASL